MGRSRAGLVAAAAIVALGVVAVVAVVRRDEPPREFSATVCGERFDVVLDDGAFTVAGPAGEGWRLGWLPKGAWFHEEVTGALPLQSGGSEDEVARLTVPDGSCTGLLADPAPSRRLRVVGDSLAFNVARSGDAADDSTWQGVPGAGFVAVTDDPVSSGIDEIRGAVADGPEALALLFGANDAVWILEAADLEELAARRAAVAEAIRAAATVAAEVPCALLVTPSVGDTDVLDLGERYAAEAAQVAATMRSIAAEVGLGIVDWTLASDDHHRPDGAEGDWFPDGDEIHPNREGQAALVQLVENVVARC